jgi:hypothetical protein
VEEPLIGSGAVPRSARNSTFEQRRARRRRREAIVVSDGRQPLRREDIIQRNDGELADEDVEADLQDPRIAEWTSWRPS